MSTHYYEIRVNGRLSEALAASLGLDADVHPVETTLHGELRDQVELHTLLDTLEALGLELVELRRTRTQRRMPDARREGSTTSARAERLPPRGAM